MGGADIDMEHLNVDLCDMEALRGVFVKYGTGGFHCCIHFAGLKAVGESMVRDRACIIYA